MSEPTPPAPARPTLRQLPLPAKLVVTTFLVAVGLGYTSAMVQMHFQHTKPDGQPMPMVDDVVEIFAGKRKPKPGEVPAAPVSKLERLVRGPIQGAPWNGSGSMAAAFFHKDPTKGDKGYKQLTDGRRAGVDPAVRAKLDAEREGERQAVLLWINLPPEERKSAYTTDRFLPPADQRPKEITPDFVHKDNGAIAVFSILKARCVECHKKGGDPSAEQYPLEEYKQLAKYLEVPVTTAPGDWCPSDRQISREKLAQSTHAHLLSFAMLFSLTGIVFAFTNYPAVVRGILGPGVLVAQVADVACWWLARLPESGPYFAMAIIATGGVVGTGLMAQIVLSLFNMYGWKGKAVVAALFAIGGLLAAWAYVAVVRDYLRDRPNAGKPATELTAPADPGKTGGDKTGNGKKEPDKKAEGPASPSKLEWVLTGPYVPKDGPWGFKAGGMVRAFFDKEDEFRDAMKNGPPAELDKLRAEREAERAALVAWVRLAADARKRAYEEDRFPLPPELLAQPVTASFKADDKTLKIKSLIDARCVTCHATDASQPEFPLTKYDEIAKYFAPVENGDKEKADAGAAPAPNPVPPAPTPVAVAPIPDAKDD